MINLYLFNCACKLTQVIIIFWGRWTHGDSLRVRELHVKSCIRLSMSPCAKWHINDILISPDGPLLASMTIQSTISPFVIDDNTHSTYAPPIIMLFFSPPLASMAKGYPFSSVSFIFQSSLAFVRVSIFYFTVNHIPCSPYHHFLLSSCSLFAIKGKGNTSWFVHA